jgi:hypothetical protein
VAAERSGLLQASLQGGVNSSLVRLEQSRKVSRSDRMVGHLTRIIAQEVQLVSSERNCGKFDVLEQ